MKKIVLMFLLSIPCLLAQGQQWIVYRDTNSGLLDNALRKIKIDKNGNKWILDDQADLVKFDGVNWTVYNYTNSGLPDAGLNAIAIDKNDNKWIATNIGLVKFDNTNWTTYNKYNSCLPVDSFYSIHDCDVDSVNNIWLATDFGVIKFDTSLYCTVYNVANGTLKDDYVDELKVDARNWIWAINYDSSPSEYINIFNGNTWQNMASIYVAGWGQVEPRYIFCDFAGNVWGSAGEGILKYNGTIFSVPYDSTVATGGMYVIYHIYANSSLIGCGSAALHCLNYYNDTVWSRYDNSNSPFYDDMNDITCDKYNNLWIAGGNGLYEFNPNGIVLGVTQASDLNSFVVQSFPNPSNNELNIEVNTTNDMLLNFSLNDVMGKEIKCEYRIEPGINGTRLIVVDLKSLNDGLYFYCLTTDKAIKAGKVLLIKN